MKHVFSIALLASFPALAPHARAQASSELSALHVDELDVLVRDAHGTRRVAAQDPFRSRATPLPLAPEGRFVFVENCGQWEEPVRFLASTPGADVWTGAEGFRLQLFEERTPRGACGVAVAFHFEGADRRSPRGEDALAGVHHYFLGADPARWARNVRRYGAVRWDEPWPGIDLVLHERDGELEYDLFVDAGADLSQAVIRCEGIEGLALDAGGTLSIATARGPLEQRPPRTYASSGEGERREVACAIRILGPDRFGFEVDPAWRGSALWIDPQLVWSTFLGGMGSDYCGTSLFIGPNGETTVAGLTLSPNFPVTGGAFDTLFAGTSEGWVARLAQDGSALLWATFLGGSADDRVQALAPHPAGGWVLAGNTSSTNFPVTAGAVQTSYGGGGNDGFVARLGANGDQLLFATYLGGSGSDIQEVEYAKAVVVDGQGAILVTGETNSPDFPVTAGAFDTSFDSTQTAVGAYDGFFSRLSANGTQLLYSTFYGGSHVDYPYDLALRENGEVALGGATASDDFPTTAGAFGSTYAGAGQDAFLLVLDPQGNGASDLVYGTYYTGVANDIPFGLDLSPDDLPTLVGFTFSDDLATTAGAFREQIEAETAHFLARFDPRGQGAADLEYATYYGGPQPVGSYVIGFSTEIVIDEQDVCTITGDTSSPAFPATDCAYDDDYADPPSGDIQWGDVFVARFELRSRGDEDLLYMTYIGSTDQERGLGVRRGTDLTLTVAGFSSSMGYPTTVGAFDRTWNGESDGVLTRIDCTPICQNYCRSTANSTGAAAAIRFEGSTSVVADDLVLVASPVPNQPGVFYFGPNQLDLPFGNGFRCVGGAIVRLPVTFPTSGELRRDLDVSAYGGLLVAGSVWNFQAWYRDPPAGGALFNLSDGMRLELCP